MARIGDVPEINAVKQTLERLSAEGLVSRWELPYENLLTRFEAAQFFLEPASTDCEPAIWRGLAVHGQILREVNASRLLSSLAIAFAFTGRPDALSSTPSSTTNTLRS